MPDVSKKSTTTSKANSIEHPTIPPLYVSYILRSKAQGKYNNRSYVGSTPDPYRRFRQHNGNIKGGAFRTRMHGPWEMEAFVYGFPNKLTALQFEWAWDHAERTHWLVLPASPGEVVPMPSTPAPKKAKKGGKKTLALSGDHTVKATESASAKGKSNAKDKSKAKGKSQANTAVIHLFPKGIATGLPRIIQRFAAMQRLLATPPFANFRLGVYLFSPDAQGWWRSALEGSYPGGCADRSAKNGTLRSFVAEAARRLGPPDCAGIPITVRHAGPDGKRLERESGVAWGDETSEGEGPLDASDKPFAEEQWAKWQSVAALPNHHCACCSAELDVHNHLEVTLCPAAGCSSLSHLECLAEHFLPLPDPDSSRVILLPNFGTCPVCHSRTHWQDIMRSSWRRHDMAAATPGQQKKKGRKKHVPTAAENWDSTDDDISLAGSDHLEEESESEVERAAVEEMEKQASFDAGYIWLPDDDDNSEDNSDISPSPQSPQKRQRESPSPPASRIVGEYRVRDVSPSASPSSVDATTPPSRTPISISSSSDISPSRMRRGRKLQNVNSPDLPSPTASMEDRGGRSTATSDLDGRVVTLALNSRSASPVKRRQTKNDVTILDISD